VKIFFLEKLKRDAVQRRKVKHHTDESGRGKKLGPGGRQGVNKMRGGKKKVLKLETKCMIVVARGGETWGVKLAGKPPECFKTNEEGIGRGRGEVGIKKVWKRKASV